MPKSIEELRGCPSVRMKQTTFERVRKEREKYWKWRKARDEYSTFNRDQAIASQINV